MGPKLGTASASIFYDHALHILQYFELCELQQVKKNKDNKCFFFIKQASTPISKKSKYLCGKMHPEKVLDNYCLPLL
jgi:hypothetical protein